MTRGALGMGSDQSGISEGMWSPRCFPSEGDDHDRYLDADPMLLVDGAGEERGGKFHALNAAVVQLVSG